MKKRIQPFLLLLLLISISLLPGFSAQAADEVIQKTEIRVELYPDGSARITQILDIDNLTEGTEYYTQIPKREHLSVSDLMVRDETERTFETLEDWDTGRSLVEKAYTCGILETDDGYELCWGLGSYGFHSYTLEYKMEGFVQAYDDSAGFYYQFYSSEIVSTIENVEITISMNDTLFSPDNSQAWPIGFSGYLTFTPEGTIHTYNEEDLKSNQNIRMLCGFDLQMFPDAPIVSGTFEAVKEEALQISSTSSETRISPAFVIGIVLTLVLLAVLIIVIVVFSANIKLSDGTRRKRPQWKDSEPRSTLPFEGNIPAACFGLKQVYQPLPGGRIFGAYLIKWENDGVLHMEDLNEGRKKKPKTIITFQPQMPDYHSCELKLYKMIYKLTDSQHVLTQKRFQKWVDENYSKITAWEKDLLLEGQTWLTQNGYLQPDAKGKSRFSPRGYEHLVALQGLHHYLKKYDQNYAAGEVHTELWGDYLIFALLLGINEQLIVYLEQSDPVYFDEFSHHYGYDTHSMTALILMANIMSHDTVAHAQMSGMDGSGGSTSIGGGGGFSGGGGGGVR